MVFIPKPTVLPRWADVGGAILTPSSGIQDVGWTTAKPPHQHANWLQYNTYKNLQHLEQFYDSNNNFIFGAGIINASGINIDFSDSPYSVLDTHSLIFADATSGNIDINLPSSASNENHILTIIKTDSSSNVINIIPNGIETINGYTDTELSLQFDIISLFFDGSNVIVLYKSTNAINPANVLYPLTIPIPAWNMSTSNNFVFAHGLNFSKIVCIDSVTIRNDAGTQFFPLPTPFPGTGSVEGTYKYDSTNISLSRGAGLYTAGTFNSVLVPRGIVKLTMTL